jgi:signal transduction histidine kinase
MKATGFETKLLSKLGKLNAEQIRRAVVQILDQKQFLLRVLDRLNEGVIVTDAQLNVVFANPKARLMLGLPPQRTQQGDNLAGMVAADNPLAEIIESLRGSPREINGYESPYGRRKDRYVALTTLVMRAGGGGGLGEPLDAPTAEDDGQHLILLLQDVTERRLRQEEQARARQLASMATLTSGIAHEIKNPLNSLNIHAQLLQDEVARAKAVHHAPRADRVERAAGVILEETRRLTRVVEDFLQAARPRQPDLQERSLAVFIERAAQVLGPECSQAGATLIVNVEPDLPPLQFDDYLLMQVLRNLARNALDALAEHAEAIRKADAAFAPTVEISAALAGDAVNLSVSDNGPGIDPKTLEHVFEPYYTTKFNGTGLGLMVVYRIVTEHKATLHVDTRPGEGTRFTISLPVHQKPVRLLEKAAPAQA